MDSFTDQELRDAVKTWMPDCLAAASAAAGAAILKNGRGGFHWPVLLGKPREKAVLRRLLTGRRDPSPIQASSRFLVLPLAKSRKSIGALLLVKAGERAFSPSQARAAADAARWAGRQLDLWTRIAALQKNYLNTIFVLLKTIEGKDPFMAGHSNRVAEYCRKAGMSLGLSAAKMRALAWAAFFHDIGKVGIVDTILQKKEKLDAEEMAIVREHPVIGQRILQDLEPLREAALAVRAHHERWDGGGYPDGLRGRKIPLLGRLLSLAEVFDTITSRTPYHPVRPVEVAAAELRKCKGTQFDPGLVDPFLEAVLL